MAWRARSVPLVAALALVSACSLRTAACGPGPGGGAPADAESAPSSPPSSGGVASGTIQIVFLGDSLTAGFGLLSEQAYPALIRQDFQAEGYNEVEIVNAGVTGDTTAGGARRVDQLLQPDTRILVIGLGGNDALRGLTSRRRTTTWRRSSNGDSSRRPAWCSRAWRRPRTSGRTTRQAFDAAFLDLFRDDRGRITFMPFLLEGVAGDPALNQADGIHPNARGREGHRRHPLPEAPGAGRPDGRPGQ